VGTGTRLPWRAAAERITHRIVVPRRLPAPFQQARIYASSEGGLRYLRPRLSTVDPTLLAVVSEVVGPGSVVWDIGANVGLFSFASAAAAGPTGRVLAVEPDAWLVRLLRRSGARNDGLAPVDVLPVAIGDTVGVGRFHIARRNRSTSHLDGFGTSEAGGVRATELVPMVTLDWLLAHFPAPDVIKIDVERAETLVLSGAASALTGRPVLICEVARVNAERVRQLLRPLGYRFYDCAVPRRLRRPLDEVPWALLAMPTARQATEPSAGGAASGSGPDTERPPSTGSVAPLMKLASPDSR
jgi:FkbM family methyltransferase